MGAGPNEQASLAVTGSAEGERDRLSLLYEAYWDQAIRLAYLITGDRDVVEDVVHQAFVRLIGRFRHLRSPESFPAYLRTTVVNVARNHLRARRADMGLLSRLPSPMSASPSHSSEVDARHDIWVLLHRLPFRQRAAVVLHYYEDLSDSEIGRVMGCSARAARGLLARGMTSMRQSFEEEET